MPFDLLKFAIASLKKKLKCPSCKMPYGSDAFFVLATAAAMKDPIFFALLLIACQKCHAEVLHGVEVNEGKRKTSIHSEQISFDSIPPHFHNGGKISMNEVLDMHNFLKNWKGDVKEVTGD